MERALVPVTFVKPLHHFMDWYNLQVSKTWKKNIPADILCFLSLWLKPILTCEPDRNTPSPHGAHVVKKKGNRIIHLTYV